MNMTQQLQVLPFMLDAASLSLVHRKELLWFDWSLSKRPDMQLLMPTSTEHDACGEIVACCEVFADAFLHRGWQQAMPQHKFHIPPLADRAAGSANHQTAESQVQQRWPCDNFRFDLPYYQTSNGVVHHAHGWRMLLPEEKEIMLGFPRGTG